MKLDSLSDELNNEAVAVELMCIVRRYVAEPLRPLLALCRVHERTVRCSGMVCVSVAWLRALVAIGGRCLCACASRSSAVLFQFPARHNGLGFPVPSARSTVPMLFSRSADSREASVREEPLQRWLRLMCSRPTHVDRDRRDPL